MIWTLSGFTQWSLNPRPSPINLRRLNLNNRMEVQMIEEGGVVEPVFFLFIFFLDLY